MPYDSGEGMTMQVVVDKKHHADSHALAREWIAFCESWKLPPTVEVPR